MDQKMICMYPSYAHHTLIIYPSNWQEPFESKVWRRLKDKLVFFAKGIAFWKSTTFLFAFLEWRSINWQRVVLFGSFWTSHCTSRWIAVWIAVRVVLYNQTAKWRSLRRSDRGDFFFIFCEFEHIKSLFQFENYLGLARLAVAADNL